MIPDCPFTPLNEWVVIQLEEAQEKKGLLYIPGTAKDAPQVGLVLDVGPLAASCVQGDRILFAKYAGATVEWIDDKAYLFVKDEDVIAKVK